MLSAELSGQRSLPRKRRPRLAGVRTRLVPFIDGADSFVLMLGGLSEASLSPPSLGWARAAAGLLGLEVPTGPVIQKATVGFCSHRERYSPSLQGVKVDTVNTLGFIFDLVGHQSRFSP